MKEDYKNVASRSQFAQKKCPKNIKVLFMQQNGSFQRVKLQHTAYYYSCYRTIIIKAAVML